MQKHSKTLALTAAAVALAALAGCAAPPPYPAPVVTQSSQPYAPAYPPANRAAYVEFGRVSAVDVITTEERGRTTGGGAIVGAVVGGLLGNTIGGGSGRALATGAGVVGGALVGNSVERNGSRDVRQTFRVTIHLDNGAVRAYDVPNPQDLRVGDRVRVQDGQISRA